MQKTVQKPHHTRAELQFQRMQAFSWPFIFWEKPPLRAAIECLQREEKLLMVDKTTKRIKAEHYKSMRFIRGSVG